MSMNEPFLPITHVGSDEIDAADPGLGAPGTPTSPTTDDDTDEAENEFEDRMEQARGEKQIFRTPEPSPTGPPRIDSHRHESDNHLAPSAVRFLAGFRDGCRRPCGTHRGSSRSPTRRVG
ncbi:hypothetical protein ACFTZB_35085 [Rhodococcus sp. NPDC057014]|uniref:hypothetical protein n=1 Tax=Rhodococcus sp. NPDC057014 TaxID=3346000 RepID=UPI00363E26DE